MGELAGFFPSFLCPLSFPALDGAASHPGGRETWVKLGRGVFTVKQKGKRQEIQNHGREEALEVLGGLSRVGT